jgi:hypothetical protein
MKILDDPRATKQQQQMILDDPRAAVQVNWNRGGLTPLFLRSNAWDLRCDRTKKKRKKRTQNYVGRVTNEACRSATNIEFVRLLGLRILKQYFWTCFQLSQCRVLLDLLPVKQVQMIRQSYVGNSKLGGDHVC